MRICIAALALIAIATMGLARDWPVTRAISPPNEGSEQRDQTGRAGVGYACGLLRHCHVPEFMERLNVCALMVIHAPDEGEKTGEDVVVYREDRDTEECRKALTRKRHGIASITKSVTSILLGKLMQSRGIEVDTPVVDLLEPLGLNYPRDDITLRDLLHMSSGMGWSEAEQQAIRIVEGSTGSRPRRRRTLATAVQDRLERAKFVPERHGRAPYKYSGFDSQLLGLVADALLPEGVTLADYLELYLWAEIEAQRRAEWKADYEGNPAAYCCLYTSAGDLGHLGVWVLDQYRDPDAHLHEWINQSVTDTRLSTSRCSARGMRQHFHYGYQWWVLSGEHNGFTGIGRGGQYLHIFPEQGIVVVQLSEGGGVPRSGLCESMLVHRLLADYYGGG